MECELENITIHYEMTGQGRPIILLHGYPLDHRYLVRDAELFCIKPRQGKPSAYTLVRRLTNRKG